MIKNLHFTRSLTRSLAFAALAIFMLMPGLGWGANLINENIQSWTSHASYGVYTQGITAGTVNMTDCIVAPTGAANGTGSLGYVQMKASTGILTLPSLATCGTVEFHIHAGGAGRTLKLQQFNGSTWTDLTTFTVNATGETFTYAVNSSSVTQLRLATASAAVYVHDIIITDYASATINVIGSFSTFTTTVGTPSASQSVAVSGSNLTDVIGVSAVTGYEYSTTDAAPWTTTLSLASTFNGSVYVHLTGASVGSPSGTISFTSTGATQVDKAVSGTVNPNTPVINVTGTFSTFSTNVGTPSASQSVAVSGSNLTSTIEIAAVSGYEYSTTNAAPWTSTLSLASSFSGNLYVRLTGVTLGSYSGNVSLTSTGATQVDKAVSGDVTAPPPVITVTGTFSTFSTTIGTPSASQSVAVSSSNLTTGIGVSAVTGYEYSTTDAAPWTSTLSLASSFSGNVYVRLTGASGGTPSGIISFTSTGATQVDKTVSGTVTCATGSFPFIENFDYAASSLLTANCWTAHSGTGGISVTSSSITYPGYLSSGVGNEVPLSATLSEDDNRTFTAQTSGTVYASFLVNVTSVNTSGDYFFHVGQTAIGSTFRGRVFVKSNASSKLAFGIAQSGTAVYTSFDYDLNTTYLVVLKYDIVAGTTNDVSSIYINPTLNATIPSTGWLTNTDAAGTDLTELGSVALRQASGALSLKLDGIRISNNWADIVGIAAPTAYAVTGTGSYCQGTGGIPVGVANSETGVTYTLTPGGATQAGTGAAISFGNQPAGTYTVSGTNIGGTTAMTGSAEITENPLPTATITPDGPTTFCAGGSVILSASAGTSYLWSDASTGATLTATTGGSYTVTVTDANGCSATSAPTVVTVNTPTTPTITPGGPTTFCTGGSVVLSASDGTSYLWSDASTGATLTATTGGSYSVTVTDANGCSATSAPTVVTVNPFPDVAGIISGTHDVTLGATGISYTVGAIADATSYTWAYSGSGVSISGSTNPVTIDFSGSATSGNLTVKGTNACGDGTVSANYAITVYPAIGWANIQWPPTATIPLGSNVDVYAQVYVSGYTNPAGQAAGMTAWIGYGTSNTDLSGYTWVLANYNADAGNNDEYKANIGSAISSTGTYYYASRFKLGTNPYVYGGTNNDIWDLNPANLGVLTVTPPPQIDWANVQYPASGTIAAGGSYNVYARVYAAGVTNVGSPGAGISSWIGYSTSNTDPSTWTNWVSATFNADFINDDEYVANIGASLPAGTYYYASRFKMGLADYVYGGYIGGFWNGTSNVSGVLTVTAPPTAYSVTGGGSYCTGGLPVGLSNSQVGVDYQLYVGSSTPVGATVPGTGGAITFGDQTAGTYTVSGTANGSVPTIAGTTAMTGSAVITLADPAVADAGPEYDLGTVGVEYTFPTASASGGTISWTIEVLNGLGSYTLTGTDGIHPVFVPGATGSAKFTLTVTGCSTPATDVITVFVLGVDPIIWNGSVSTSWNTSSNWTPAIIPDATSNVEIRAGSPRYPTILAAAYCNNIDLKAGASLIDNGNLSVSGTVMFEHAPIASGRWHLVSPPVSGLTSGMFSGQFLSYHTTSTNLYTAITATSTPLGIMQGYALYPKSTGFSAPFVGGLNPATNNFTISGAGPGTNGGDDDRWNLVGNPYTSAINWDATSGWTKTGVNDAIYILDNAAWKTYINGVGVNGGTNIIAPIQGFFVRASGSGGGSLQMTSSVRVHDNAVPLYKSAGGAVPDMVRLEVSGNGYKDEAVVRFTPNATAEFDGNYDAYKLYGNVTQAAQLYTLGSTPLAINSLPESALVPVGVKVGVNGSYTIAATEINDLQYVTLEDTETGIFTDLSTGSYTFDAVAGTSNQRFKLLFSLLGVKETKKTDPAIYSYQHTVHINMKDQVKGDIYIFNIAGQQVASRMSAQGMNEIKLPNGGNYIVKVISKNSTVVRKVFIQQ